MSTSTALILVLLGAPVAALLARAYASPMFGSGQPEIQTNISKGSFDIFELRGKGCFDSPVKRLVQLSSLRKH
ncbi:hypothetical protein DXU07_18035 [Bradyrhizobium elkanii]|nr:hypothetical protein BLN97_10970 [Bradyrhizobium elkanii]